MSDHASLPVDASGQFGPQWAVPAHELAPGQQLARGVCRHLAASGFAPLTEFMPVRGLRVDVIAIGPKGQVWVVECKSSRADFASDKKWSSYLDWCDRFFWAVPPGFPVDVLPGESGLILADAWGAETLRTGPEHRLAAPRRRALTQAMARTAALRLRHVCDPGK